MTNGVEMADVAADLAQGGDALLRLTRDPALFAEAIKAYRGRDSGAWNQLLEKAKLLGLCHRVCEWVCSKECVRLCILLAGVPKTPVTIDQIGPFTDVLTRLAKQPKLIEALVRAVEAEDARAFRAVADELKALPYLHLLCHWVCFLRCHLVCRVLCERAEWKPGELIARLRDSAVAVASVAKSPDQLKRVIDGAATLNCAALKDIFGAFEDCRLICFWLCSWRCLIVCLRLTRSFAMTGDFSVEEMRAFGLFCGGLLRDPAAVNALVAAVVAQDEKAFVTFVRAHKADKFVHQLCHWVCCVICQRLCICVCPPPGIIPIFDHVGAYRVDPFYHDFAADGTTTAGGYAFTGTIPLIGLLPPSPVADPVEYRFTVQKLPAGPVQPLTIAEIGGSVIGSLEFWEWDATALPAPGQWMLRTADYSINNAPQFRDIQQDIGPPLHVQVSTPIAPDGWVRVPSDDNLTHHGGGKFAPTHLLASLDTTKLTLEQFDLHGPGTGLPMVAGGSVPAGPPAADNKRSEKPLFTINFEARKGIGHASLLPGPNSLPVIALSNMRYAFERHPDWAGSDFSLAVNPYPMVLLVDIEELLGHGCNPITANTTIHTDYTAYHPYLASCTLMIEGPPPAPATFAPPRAGGEAAGMHPFDLTGFPSCAYILWLRATLNLTSGYGAIGGIYEDHIAFCVH